LLNHIFHSLTEKPLKTSYLNSSRVKIDKTKLNTRTKVAVSINWETYNFMYNRRLHEDGKGGLGDN
jgi:hypothetical protein